MRINVGNIRPSNRQCKHCLIPCIEISFVGQAQGDLNALRLIASQWWGCFSQKDPLTNPCRNCGIRSKNFSGRENQSGQFTSQQISHKIGISQEMPKRPTYYQVYPPILPGLAHCSDVDASLQVSPKPSFSRLDSFHAPAQVSPLLHPLLETCRWLLFLNRGLIACLSHVLDV